MVCMRTKSEKKFTGLVISMIMSSHDSHEDKIKRLKSFFNNHSYYYENLCYNTYAMTMLPGTNILSIDDNGVSYVNLKELVPERKYYDILVLNEYSPVCGDVIMHIEAALSHLDELLGAETVY